MEKKHILLNNEFVESISYTPKTKPLKKQEQQRNIAEHAKRLKECYANSITTADAKIQERARAKQPSAKGVYLDINLKGKILPFDKFDNTNVHLLNIAENQDDSTMTTVFLPLEKKNWLNDRIDKYKDENNATKKGEPANKTLINPIENITCSDAKSLFPNKEEYEVLEENSERIFEIWVDEVNDEQLQSFRRDMEAMGISVIENENNVITFENVTVFLVRALKESIDNIPFSLDNVEAIKLYHNPAIMIEKDEDQRDWSKLIEDYISVNLGENPVIVGLLDMGVNNGHELIKPFLSDERRASVVDGVGVGHEGCHGTGMAGMIEYGDLSKYQKGTGCREINHALASVKLLSNNHKNNPSLYGRLTEEAINVSDKFGAKIICMAVTEDEERNDGIPSSWSAAVDKALYNDGACDRLMLISAGNTDVNVIDSDNYLDTLSLSSMQSPTQASNAIAVGAYTDYSFYNKTGWSVIAPPSGISPMTRTSVLWRGKNAKPDIVMEGGNVAHHKVLGNVAPVELSPISTNHEIPQRPLQIFNMTSAATALASRLAARIKTANPDLSMLSVRALMIHSAEWTESMKRINCNTTKIMEYCGYGVPQEEKAIASDETNVTFIVENELIPYTDEGKYNEMHFYDLPWPRELLEGMGAENVKMRITLSYYIEPSPGFKSKFNKYRYASSALFFDVKTALESRDQFIARNNKEQQVQDKSDNDSKRWKIGKQRRSVGTVQSDWFECSARELADCNQIGVFPDSGWWKYRKIANIDNKIKYSLVVTISSSETEIYDTVKAKIQNKIPVEIHR